MSPTLPKPLANAHAWIRQQAWLGRFTLMNRLLLAMAFIPTGLVKATGHRFTALPIDNPVGFFFEAMFQTGAFWNFIGIMQIVSAVFLLIPATATLGAVMFLPIIFSIVLVTWGIGFTGTIWITLLMLISVTYLIAWDADKIWTAASSILGKTSSPPLLAGATLVEKSGWILGGLMGIALLMTTRNFIPAAWRPELFFTGVGAFLMVVSSWIWSVIKRSSVETDPIATGANH